MPDPIQDLLDALKDSGCYADIAVLPNGERSVQIQILDGSNGRCLASVKGANAADVAELALKEWRESRLPTPRTDTERLDWLIGKFNELGDPDLTVNEVWKAASRLCPLRINEAEQVLKWFRVAVDAEMAKEAKDA